jgi:TonB family protein
VALDVARRRFLPMTTERSDTIEVTTFVRPPARGATTVEAPAGAVRRHRAPVPKTSEPAAAGSRTTAVEPTMPSMPAARPPSAPIDLFASDALARAMTAAPSDPGGRLRRSTDPPARADDERETVAARVHDLAADAVARERATSGNVAPRWREIERKLSQSFHPPLAVVKQENVVKAFAHQVLRSWLDGDPRVGPVPRGVDPSVETPPGVPPGLNLRTMPTEQALAVQARWGEPASWLRVEVEVTLDDDGSILSARVLRPSGRRLFDRTALAAVEDAIRAGGAPEEHRVVVTRWLVEAAVAVAPPTSIGFRFDESGHLDPGAHGWRKYIAPTYPMQQSIRSHVSLVAIEPQR